MSDPERLCNYFGALVEGRDLQFNASNSHEAAIRVVTTLEMRLG